MKILKTSPEEMKAKGYYYFGSISDKSMLGEIARDYSPQEIVFSLLPNGSFAYWALPRK
jgi:hypothetical protein